MKDTSTATAQTPNDLLEEIRTLVADAEKIMGESPTGYSADAMSALRARYDAAQEHLVKFYAGARQKVVAGVKCTDEAIRANPYQALAVALGAGLLVGVLLGRRGKS